ncbi:hypothetical protein KC330_g37 [Hortaea werneckii]|nr:hypothetical protein KC330_g37 [Hortaea werneckii]
MILWTREEVDWTHFWSLRTFMMPAVERTKLNRESMLQPGVSRAADVAGRRPTCGVNAQPREAGEKGQVAGSAGYVGMSDTYTSISTLNLHGEQLRFGPMHPSYYVL